MNQSFISKVLVLAAIISMVSCKRDDSLVKNSETVSPEFLGCPEIVLGAKLNNPYALSNMQDAYESLVRTKSGDDVNVDRLKANCLYVRFLPKDSTDVAILQGLNLELFDYPLDYDIVSEGSIYHDPSLSDNQITWQYTTVDPDFSFPDMEYQILEECFIPEESIDTRSGIITASELEELAILNAHLPDKFQPDETTKAFGIGKKPEGTIKVYNDCTGVAEGIRGVKVRCHFLVNISSCFTDEKGNYRIRNRYVCNPHYAIVYENTKDFVIWGNFAFIAAANHNLGYRSNTGFSMIVDPSDNGWKWAVINNAAYDFYKMCSSEGLKTPPPSLRIWCWPYAKYSSAPMLRHLMGVNSGGFSTLLISVLIKGAVTPAAAIISAVEFLISSGMPDLTIGMTYGAVTPNRNYKEHYYTVWHELTHASHFNQVGERLWGAYVNYIVTQGFDYGNGTAKESVGKGFCELGESWAYANEYYSAKKTWSPSSIWFNSSVVSIKRILDEGILTRKQIYDCLTKDVKSIEDLKRRMIEKYPSKSSEINEAF